MLSQRLGNILSTLSNPELEINRNRLHSKELIMGVMAVGLAVIGSAVLSIYNRGKRTQLTQNGGWEELDLTKTKD